MNYPFRDHIGCLDAVHRPIPRGPRSLVPVLFLADRLARLAPGKYHSSELVTPACRLVKVRKIGHGLKMPVRVGDKLVRYVRGYWHVSVAL